MQKLLSDLQHTEFSKQSLVTMLRNFAKKEQINFGQMMRTLRSNNEDGYQVAEMLEVLGKESSLLRLSSTQTSYNSSKLANTN